VTNVPDVVTSAEPQESRPEGAAPAEIVAVLRRAGFVAADIEPRFVALTGGVASDIWKVETGGPPIVVKRALPKLRVAAEWLAPVERNAAEADWFRVVGTIVPEAVPEVLFHDTPSGLFAMPYFPPQRYPVWKAQLRDGAVDLHFAARVGATLGRIHAATMDSAPLAERFANDETFHAIRLEPYLEATARRHTALADRLMELSQATLACRHALVHGDVSPKNILAGPAGPVLLDAECAWYGDPAFDLAFCLNHLLLKCVWNRAAAPHFLTAYDVLRDAYFGEIPSAVAADIEARAARLLPALFLARIDGKSPVEYITTDADRDLVRSAAIPLILAPVTQLSAIRNSWAAILQNDRQGLT
jgi:aminoglycoside phosphotransferase (APT) family kinase protein